MHKTKNLQNKSQESTIKTCHKKKKTRLKSIKEKSIKNIVLYIKEALKNK